MDLRLFAFGLVIAGSACSVINSYDDVVEASGGSGQGGASAGAGGKGGSSSGGTSTGSGGANGGEGGEGTTPMLPTTGLVVLGGTTLTPTEGLISVLDPVTGVELDREELPSGAQVAGIAYDGALGRDVWFVFQSTEFPAEPDTPVDMQVRRFDDESGSWTVLDTTTALPAPKPHTFAVLNDRLAYISAEVQSGNVVPTLTILDTADLENVVAVDFEQPPLSGEMIGLLGVRGTPANPNGLGGTLDLAVKQNCNPGGGPDCELFVQPLAVGSGVSPTVGQPLGSFIGTPAFATARGAGLVYFALPPPTGSVAVYRSEPRAPENAMSFTAPPAVSDLGGLTIAECQNVGVLTSSSEQALYGVTLSVAAGRTLDLGRPGQLVEWEPFTRDVIATFNPTMAGEDPEIAAITVTSNQTGTSLNLERRAAATWDPPTDVRVNAMAVRFPFPFACE